LFLKSLRGDRVVKEFSIVEDQPGLEESKGFDVHWMECILPSCDPKTIKSSIDNIAHRWKKEVIKKAENPFAQVQGK
jgi:hypothetical protein